MTTAATTVAAPGRSPARRAAAWLHRHRWLRLGLLLLLPLLWLGVVYLGSLFFLFINAFWSTDPFTSQVVREFTLDNFETLLSGAVYRTVTIRTIGFAVAVTATCIVLAYPIAFYMVARTSRRVARACATLTRNARRGDAPLEWPTFDPQGGRRA